MQYNTVVSALMKMLNTLEDAKLSDSTQDSAALAECFSILLRVLYPVCPHLAYFLWGELGYAQSCGGLLDVAWAGVDETALVRDEIELMLQVNGKLRGSISVPATASKEDIEQAALANEAFQKQAQGASPKKVIVVPGRLVNVVL
jgi:leucyl-tRNA synthetase